MYERVNQGVLIEWDPDDEQAAIQAMDDVDGTGVPDTHTLPDDAPVRVSQDVADAVRVRYEEITAAE